MTRINANIPPKFLSDHHLRAETKEILRIPRLFKQKYQKTQGVIEEIPEQFCLGEGHLNFFMDKGSFIEGRYHRLCDEMQSRGLDYPIFVFIFDVFKGTEYDKGWDAEQYELANLLVVERIIDKMLAKLRIRPNYSLSYYGKLETPETTIKRLLKAII